MLRIPGISSLFEIALWAKVNRLQTREAQHYVLERLYLHEVWSQLPALRCPLVQTWLPPAVPFSRFDKRKS